MRDEAAARTGAVIASFVLGAIAGAAVAMLLAPASGDEVRQRLAESAKDGRERAGAAARRGREFLNRQRETVAAAVERGREAYQQARSSATQPAGGGETL